MDPNMMFVHEIVLKISSHLAEIQRGLPGITGYGFDRWFQVSRHYVKYERDLSQGTPGVFLP